MSSTSTDPHGLPGAEGNGNASANGEGNGGRTRLSYVPLFQPSAPAGVEKRDRRATVVERKRRVLNIFIGAAALVIASPLMILIALALKLTSRGPVLYSQNRVGLDRRRPTGIDAETGRRRRDRGGKIFTIYKFRTMTTPRHDPGEVWATPDDPRVTRLGSILRKYRLDELPQLFNVLRGDMNIVGPRPEQPEIFEQLRSKVERYVERQRVLPGITGWAQVNQSYDQCLEDVRTKVVFDLEYIRRRSTLEDLRIMAKTLPVMIGKKGSV